MKKIFLSILLTVSALAIHAQSSPDGRIKVSTADNKLAISYKLNNGWITIMTADMSLTPDGKTTKVSESYTMLTGKKSNIKVKANQAAYTTTDGATMLVRVQNDGVALRKVGKNSEAPISIDMSYATNNWLMKWTDSYEGFFPKNVSIKNGDRWGYPALFEYESHSKTGNVFVLLTEADVHSDMAASCMYSMDKAGHFRLQHDTNDNAASMSTWKTFIIGSLADVVESTLVTDLSTPCKLDDTSWIKPGVASWVYWANNHGSNDCNIIRKYTDMAAELHLPYVLIDAEWDEMKDGKTVEDAVAYAREKGVMPMIWYNSSVGWVNGAPGPKYRLNKPEDREKEFAWCEKIGVKGVKIDFFSGDNNLNMKYMIDLLECAARHHLLVNFHGATIPRGWQRTYPNLISTEGVYGAEWYNNVPTFTNKAAAHNAMLPFTRNVIGPMDYTPCAFTDSQHPHITTHAHELALTVLFESGIQHLADRPESFLSQPKQVKDFLSSLPTAWDETRLLSGYPGKSVVIARRKGNTWYIAGINGSDTEETLLFNNITSLKGVGRQRTIFLDSGNAAAPWTIISDKLNKDVPVMMACKPRGGFVMVCEK